MISPASVTWVASPYVEERVETIQQLALFKSPESLSPLLSCLGQETEPAALAYLVRTVLSYQNSGHRDTGLKYVSHPSPEVRRATVEGFWGWRDSAVDGAVLALQKDESPRPASAVDVYLIRRGLGDSTRHASTLLASDDTARRIIAIYALAGVQATWSSQLITDVIRDGSQPQGVRTLARHVAVLQSSSVRPVAAGVAPEADETIRTDLTLHMSPIPDAPTLRAALQGKEPLMRMHALQNAARFAASESIQVLERLIRWETDSIVVATLVKAFAKVGGPPHASSIVKFLGHTDARVRANTLEALATVDESIDLVSICKAKLLEDDSPRVRTQAASYLFRKNPDEAVKHFKKMVLGMDAAARDAALLILTTMHDERILPVFRQALLDPRREVYMRSHQVLEALSHEWERAKHFLDEFKKGRIAGEVIDDEPVSALLEAVNSPRLPDKLHAIQKLAKSKDPRVDVVLELNLMARSLAVRREAQAALGTRLHKVTLPNLFARLGQSFVDLTSAGHALVPFPLKRKIAEIAVLDGAGGTQEDLARHVGRVLYEAFEREEAFDAALRRTCEDIQSAIEQVKAPRPGSPEAGPGDRTGEPRRGEALLFAQFLEKEARDEESEDAAVAGSTQRSGMSIPAICIGLGALSIGAVVVTSLLGVASSPQTSLDTRTVLAGEAGQTFLNRMAFEKDRARFADLFGGQTLEFRAYFDRVGDDLVTTYFWSGSVQFCIHPGLGTQKFPRNLQRRQACAIVGQVQERTPDGTISMIGGLKSGAP